MKLIAYGWGLVDKDGKPYFAHDCIAQHPEDLRQTIEYLNEPEGDEDHRAPYRVVQLFYKEEE